MNKFATVVCTCAACAVFTLETDEAGFAPNCERRQQERSACAEAPQPALHWQHQEREAPIPVLRPEIEIRPPVNDLPPGWQMPDTAVHKTILAQWWEPPRNAVLLDSPQ